MLPITHYTFSPLLVYFSLPTTHSLYLHHTSLRPNTPPLHPTYFSPPATHIPSILPAYSQHPLHFHPTAGTLSTPLYNFHPLTVYFPTPLHPLSPTSPLLQSWHEAHNFCRGLDGFLPSRDEYPLLKKDALSNATSLTWTALTPLHGHYQWLSRCPGKLQ